MQTMEIPREAWIRHLNEFTKIHEGQLERTDDGVDTALQIVSADGTATLLRLHTRAASETRGKDCASLTT